jgi:uncharacterized protein YjbI with pentapeptide repeats
VGAALGLSSCSTTAGATVTLVRARPGEASTLIGHGFPTWATEIQIRFTSGTGNLVEVLPYRMADTDLFNGIVAPTTVVDSGSAGAWTTVTPGYPPAGPTFDLQEFAFRLTTAANADVALTYEVRGIGEDGQPGSPTTTISPFGADCGQVQPRADLRAIDLSGLDLRGCVIPGVTLDPGKLTNTNLRGADLSDATILPGAPTGTRFVFARLGDATLAGVDFSGAASVTDVFLADADLGQAVLRNTNIGGADVGGADLSTATLEGVSSGALIGTPSLPAGWLLRGGYLIHRTADLTNAFLREVDLSNLDLTGAQLEQAYLGGADLHGTDLTGADLRNAVLGVANLQGTELDATQLTGVSSGLIVGVPTSLPAAWTLEPGGYLIGPGAALLEADLAGIDLHGRDLSGVVLASANLTNADLSGSNLSNGDLSYATLTGTVLTGADVAHAVFYGATGTPVYAGVDFSTATCPDGTLGAAHANTCQGHPWP